MVTIARALLAAGGLLVLFGVLLLLAARLGLPLGRLPGDVALRGRWGAVFFPLGTSLLLSVLVSFVLWLVNVLRG